MSRNPTREMRDQRATGLGPTSAAAPIADEPVIAVLYRTLPRDRLTGERKATLLALVRAALALTGEPGARAG